MSGERQAGAISREFGLLAACVTRPVDTARVRAAAQAVDWPAYVAVAVRHRVAGLAAEGLGAAGLSAPDGLLSAARSDAMTALRLMGETVRINERLDAAGIACAAVKGSALAQEAYGSPTIRHARDVDVLVAPADVPAAWAVLEADGYRRIWPPAHLKGSALASVIANHKDSTLRHPVRKVEVELHWRLSEVMTEDGLPTQAPLRRISLGGRPVQVLSADFLFVYLCTHGGHHAWMRLKWLADIAALLAKAPDGGRGYWAEAERRGAQVGVEVAVRLAARLFGAPLPGWLGPEAGVRVRLLERAALKALMAEGGADELYDRPALMYGLMTAFRLLGHRNMAVRLQDVRRLGFSLDDRVALPLPRALHGLYPALRGPMWVWRRATGFRLDH